MQTARKKNPSQNCALQLHALFHSIFHIFILLELFSAFATFVKEVEIEKKTKRERGKKPSPVVLAFALVPSYTKS